MQYSARRVDAPEENSCDEKSEAKKKKKKRQKKTKKSIEMWFKEMETWTSRVMFYRSMLNCVNALEGHIPPAESAALMVAEEKPHPDSCKALKQNPDQHR